MKSAKTLSIRPLSVFLGLLFPPRCAFCRKLLGRGEEGLCGACEKNLPWTGSSALQKGGEFYSACAAPLWYQATVRDSFHRYKFRGTSGYAGVYGRLMADCIREQLAGRYDLVTWAPLSPRRLKKRGYDQAMMLASAVALELGDVAVSTLEKVRETEAQSGLGSDPGVRRANVLGAYRVTDPELILGRRVLLIDDIVTTGATLSECARSLRAAGAADVVCTALARAGTASVSCGSSEAVSGAR